VAVEEGRAVVAVTPGEVCEGNVIHRGRTIATADGRVTAADTGKLLAHGTTTCLLSGGKGR
jgi:acyl-coenzyme A thioesterase PaaI-like protein